MTTRKMIVSADSRIDRAISLGVFWRLAPSIRPIMRSMKLSPGSAVTRTLISSERTVVPPVTAERSPPASRMTGADSPVMADSFTRRRPFDDLAVGGDQFVGGDDEHIAFAQRFGRNMSESMPSGMSLWPMVLVRLLRRASAWALPRPSAMASAKLANSTVNHSQMAICSTKRTVACSLVKNISTVVTTAPTSVTNITGFFDHVKRVELLEALPDRGDDDLRIEQ